MLTFESDVVAAWHKVLPFMQWALRKNPHNDWSPDRMRDAIASGQAWLFWVDGERGVLVVEMHGAKPAARMHVLLLAGKLKPVRYTIWQHIETLAKTVGANRVSYESNRGWHKLLPEFRQVSAVYERQIS